MEPEIFDHKRALTEVHDAEFLEKENTAIDQEFAKLGADIADLRNEPDRAVLSTKVACAEKRLAALNKRSDELIAAKNRYCEFLRTELGAKLELIEGLLSYGIACRGLGQEASFILACIGDFKSAKTEAERSRHAATIHLALQHAKF